MKKLFLFMALAVFALNVNAQDETLQAETSQGVTFGVKAGMNFANLNGDIEENDMKLGFHFGGVAEIMFNDKFAVQPELLYSSQGTQFDFAGETLKYNLDYINVPVMAKYYVAEGFSVEAGPQVGFLVSAKSKFDGDTEDIEDLKSIDFGFNFGAGYKLDSGLNFSARYNLGLSNIDDVDNSDFEIKNGVIQVSVGYMF